MGTLLPPEKARSCSYGRRREHTLGRQRQQSLSSFLSVNIVRVPIPYLE